MHLPHNVIIPCRALFIIYDIDKLIASFFRLSFGVILMRKSLLVSVAVIAAFSVTAGNASDLPSKKSTPQAPVVSASWAGFYAGVNGGYAWGRSSQRDTSIALPPADGDYNVSGGLVGGSIGYNWQSQSFVYGVEGDASYAGISGSSSSCGGTPHKCGTETNAFATARLRGGYAFGNTLLYMTGGAAFAEIKAYDNGWTGTAGKNGSGFQTTWTVGAGIEHKIDARWSVKAEYLYAPFGRKAYFQLDGFTPEKVNLNLNVVRVGLNYKF